VRSRKIEKIIYSFVKYLYMPISVSLDIVTDIPAVSFCMSTQKHK